MNMCIETKRYSALGLLASVYIYIIYTVHIQKLDSMLLFIVEKSIKMLYERIKLHFHYSKL